MINVYPMIDKKYWPTGLKHTSYWSNNDVNSAVENILTIGVKKPSLFFLGFNCRNDFEIGIKVSETIDKFKKAGLDEKNTIFLLCSDHGYPDKSKSFGPDVTDFLNLSHDIYLTDDNIMIPFILKYPGCNKGLKVKTTVSTLDMAPTILDILNIPIPEKMMGNSLLKLKGENTEHISSRLFRSDSRLAKQKGRVTTIRGNRHKYFFYHDNLLSKDKEQFFDIKKDAYEKNNIINDPTYAKVVSKYRDFSSTVKKRLNAIISNTCFMTFLKRNEYKIKKSDRILLVDFFESEIVFYLYRIISKLNPNSSVSILSKSDFFSKFANISFYSSLDDSTFDLVLVNFDTDNYSSSDISNYLRKVDSKETLFLDHNMRTYKNHFHIILNYSRENSTLLSINIHTYSFYL